MKMIKIHLLQKVPILIVKVTQGILYLIKNKNSDGDSGTDDEEKILKRGYSIIGGDYSDNNTCKNLKGKLTFIRSNFYNKFKI